jgi:ADP-ribosylglycohydrolase
MTTPDPRLSRAQGCLLGQLAGDALGSLVEFKSASEIARRYPKGVRDMVDGGTWNTIAGQPTDDSEMALGLARVLVAKRRVDPLAARDAYRAWLDSHPFDCGATVSAGLRGRPNHDSQANGALMRISPLGIFGATHPLESVAQWAREDAALTHPHPICQQANALYAVAIARAIKDGATPASLYREIVAWAKESSVDPALAQVIAQAADHPPRDFVSQQGWVLIAFQNTLWQLLHAPNTEEAIVDTIMRGGDTDTNAAICGALLGAVHGRESIPQRWIDCLLECRPKAGNARVHRPRPECYWPVDALELAAQLLG